MEWFTGRRWNGAEWNRLELAKSGPPPADVSVEAASGDSSAGMGAGDCTGQVRQLAPVFARHLVRGFAREEICLSRGFPREKQEMPGDYYFLLPACLTDTAAFFFWVALSALDFCCVDFFRLDFGDLSPIMLLLFFALTGLRHN